MAEEEKKVLPKVRPEEVRVLPPADEIPGVKPQVAKGIEKMLQKGKRYFGSSGASLTHQVNNPDPDSEIKPELAKVGLEAERDTTKFLRNWMKDKPGVVLIDSVHINMDYKSPEVDEDELEDQLDEETGVVDGKDTDHVLLIGDQVVLIDTKRWKKKRRYSVSENGQALRANRPFPGSRIRMRNAIYLWLEYLHEDANISGMVLINSPEVSVTRNLYWYREQAYRLVEIDRFEELLNDRWEKCSDEDRKTVNSTLVAQVALSAIKPFDPYTKVFNEKTFNEFRNKEKQ